MSQQRKGQWLWNHLSKNHSAYPEENNEHVGFIIWNISDEEFDKIMNEKPKLDMVK